MGASQVISNRAPRIWFEPANRVGPKNGCHNKSQKQEEDKNTAATTYTSNNEVTLLCNQEYCCHVAEQDVEWVVDSTTSYHYVHKREYFSTYKVGD